MTTSLLQRLGALEADLAAVDPAHDDAIERIVAAAVELRDLLAHDDAAAPKSAEAASA